MSKNPKPTREELEFVYALLLKGDREQEVLDEYARLYDAGKLMFPYRVDKRFVQDRMRELAAAEKALRDRLEKKVDPLLAQRRKEHFDNMAAVAKTLLANGIETVEERRKGKPHQPSEPFYLITEEDFRLRISREELASRLFENLDMARGQHGNYDVECLTWHLLDDYAEIADFGLEGLVNRKPYEVIETLLLLSRKKTFANLCPVCNDWQ